MVKVVFHNGYLSPGFLASHDWDGMQSRFNELSDDDLYEKEAPPGYTTPLTASKKEIGYVQLD